MFLEHVWRVGHVQVYAATGQKVRVQLHVAGVVVDEALVLDRDALGTEFGVEIVADFLRTCFRGYAASHHELDRVFGSRGSGVLLAFGHEGCGGDESRGEDDGNTTG